MSDSTRPVERPGPRALFAWCLYDWANSGFPTVVTTFVFAAYFTKAIATDTITGTAQWGYALSASGLAIAVIGPIAGAIADHAGRRKPWVLAFSALCVVATLFLWFARPDPEAIMLTLILVAVANVGFETAMVFYNAMLPSLVPNARIGRLSGWGWGLGYFGGLTCLVIALVVLVMPETAPFGLDKGSSEHVRATAPLVAFWFAVFSLPFFLWTPDVPKTDIALAAAVRRGLATLGRTLRKVRDYRAVALYLLARMVYTDGLNTLFAVGGIYAAVTFGMDEIDVLVFGIAINITAGAGAVAFAWIDDWIGPKRTIVISVSALTVIGGVLLLIESQTAFWALALLLGLFFGPAQAASRSMMARLAPPELRAEMFGLYAFSGKATAFIGPALFAAVTQLANSQRAGMATILVFFVVGLALLAPVRDPGR